MLYYSTGNVHKLHEIQVNVIECLNIAFYFYYGSESFCCSSNDHYSTK